MTHVEAYEPPPPNDWVRPVVVGWALFMGGFGAWGWVAANGYTAGGFISAAVSVAACLILINASVQMRRAGAKKAHRATLVWLIALALFGSWSGYSAHHAFEMSQGGPVELGSLWTLEAAQSAFLLAFFLGSAWIDPWLMWAVEETERAVEKKVKNDGSLEGSTDHEPGSKTKRSRDHLRSIAGGLTGSLALAMSPAAQGQEPGSVSRQPAHEPRSMSQRMSPAHARNLSDADRAQARLLLRQGQSPAAVHRVTGVPHSTLKRWAREAA